MNQLLLLDLIDEQKQKNFFSILDDYFHDE